MRRLLSASVPFTGVLGLLALWWAVTAAQVFPPQVLASPARVVEAARDGLQSGELLRNVGLSLSRLAVGYVVGAGLGLAFGTAMALSKSFESYTAGLFHAIRQVPTVAFIPMLVLVFGVEETFKIVVVAKAAFYPTALATYTGVQGVPRRYYDVAEIYRFSALDKLWRVVGPATLPPVLTGLRLSLSRAWVALVAAELLVADSGIGQMMEMGRQTFQLEVVLLGVVLIGAIGFALDRAFRQLELSLVRGAPA
ncbi:ABC transporter permease [Phenylobacterium sp. LjRoot219]|uniref:ABC transporter permease n=1 Tax=Phenylobacterium sp. LjRoot219 TaxID=3342283 RepID=UPI003ED04A61